VFAGRLDVLTESMLVTFDGGCSVDAKLCDLGWCEGWPCVEMI
jgi:hypothetical protein